MNISRNNNFDLIRLIAAFQVLIWHGAVHLGIFTNLYGFLTVLFHFPGVPIFFTISGFLISNSLERSNFNLKKYTKNRTFRIYPALWICTIFTTFLLFLFKQITVIKDFILWFLAQISFFQFYTSPSLKNWGTGSPNGSLWSIAVELQFYLILPIILFLINIPKKQVYINLLIGVFFAGSIFIKYFIQTNSYIIEHQVFYKVLTNTVFYYLHFFLIGIAIYKNFKWLEKYLKNKVLLWLLVYVIYVVIFQVKLKYYLNAYDISIWGVIANTLLALLTVSFAFSFVDLSKKLLHENDISYGIYIYHLPIINAMLSLGVSGMNWHLLLMTITTIILASLSWIFIEKKIIKLKS